MALLFVVSLILFITLLGTSFVVVSQQFSKSAKARTRIEATGDDSSTLVKRAMYELLRGPAPENVASPLRTHSLLGDMYGYGIAAEILTADPVNYTADVAPTPIRIGSYDLPGAIEFTLDPATLTNLLPGGMPPVLTDIPGFFNGQVLTFTSGVLSGTSVRIVGYTGAKQGFFSATPAPYTFIAYPEQSRDVPTDVTTDLPGARVIINGRAYHGWGAGGVGAALALAPNRAFADLTMDGYVSSGINESYDALDHQNMFLGGYDTNGDIIASFDREQLFISNGGGSFTAPQNFRAFGIPTSDLQVDTDGDGIDDSIWIDIGLPVQTDKDGRRYKPLVAYFVQDLDSRLDANAHGSLYDLDLEDDDMNGTPDSDGYVDRGTQDSGSRLLGNVDPLFSSATDPAQVFPNNIVRSGLTTGHFYGPPDISMWSLFDRGSAPGPDLVEDNEAYLNLLSSRYGTDGLPGAGFGRDRWNLYLQAGHPDNINEPTYPNGFVGGHFGTYLDLHGRFTAGIPEAYFGTTNLPFALPGKIENTDFTPGSPNETGNSAYEFTLMPQSRFSAFPAELSDDQPYTIKELERILRSFDYDSRMLPSRLLDTFETTTGGNLLVGDERNAITTRSVETPAIPGFDAVGSAAPISITELTYNALIAGGFNPATDDINLALADLLSFETRMGLPFDLNKAFGDGRDDDADDVYDEIDEMTGGSTEQLDAPDGAVTMSQVVNDGAARYQYAKQLYVLTLLVTGQTGVIGFDVDPATGNDDSRIRLTLAQWVANVVDYRDSDSICTPFEFDANPFDADGWSADGDLTTTAPNTSYVWGLERPELLLSESFAFHDRRTEDLSEGGTVSGGTDTTYDSRLVPNASVFFELYRPWTPNENNQLHPAEFTPTDGSDPTGLDLLRVTANDSPVWRMVVSGSETAAGDPSFNSLFRDVGARPGIQAIPEANQVRRIYFVRPTTVETNAATLDKVYFPSDTVQGLLGPTSIVQPGRFAVIGSAGKVNGTAYETWLGRRNTPSWDTELNETRGFTLSPSIREVEIREGIDGTTTLTHTDVAVIPIDMTSSTTGVEITRSLGISDPRGGYYDYETLSDVVPVPDGYAFTSTQNEPVDTTTGNTRIVGDEIKATFSSVYLQRLANPDLDYDPVTNPYLTIDRQAIDLNVFNGAVADDSDDTIYAGGDLTALVSNERGRYRNPEVNTDASTYPVELRRRLWPIEGNTEIDQVVPRPPDITDVTHFFKSQPYTSIGTFNRAYTHPDFDPAAPVGFAQLQWNNRPFANRYELMDVPFTNSYEFLASREIGSPVGYTLEKSQLGAFGAAGEDSPYDQPVRGGWHGHLLNFYSTNPLLTDPDGLIALFDFVRVPSRFVGTNIHVNDSATLAPPYNTISRYREPGKINLNTALHPKVKQGLFGMFTSNVEVPGELTDGTVTAYTQLGKNLAIGGDFESSRRQAPAAPSVLFDNPYRTANEFDKTPPLLNIGVAVNATLLRFNYVAPPPPPPPALPATPMPGENRTEDPVLQAESDFPWADPDRSSFHRHEIYRRLGATTTTRSSVFAIWVTVGRFEVDENDNLVKVNAGMATERGVEIGADFGNAKRSRGFFIVDRSIPVGFEPGKNHNVENMILTQSIID